VVPPKDLLTQEQKEQLRTWIKDKDRKKSKGKRLEAALKKQIKEVLEEVDKKMDKDKSEEEDNYSAKDAATKEFGRSAHNKKKARKDSA
jgi:hypothetical protein